MSEPSQSVESIATGDEEQIMHLEDIIKQDEEMMEECAAVLGAGDDYNCSYSQGYMKRQALYACLTCIPEGKNDYNCAAGVCLACSYHCHDGHNLIELYTKRHFRCDCGNSKFGEMKCNLEPAKDALNVENKCNQNFCGLYCICSKPYPDPEDTVEDDMIQCTICEDWFHSRHLNTPAVDDFAEMICEACVKENDFLLSYSGLAVTKVEAAKTETVVAVEENTTMPAATDVSIETQETQETQATEATQETLDSKDETKVAENESDAKNTEERPNVDVEVEQPETPVQTPSCSRPTALSDTPRTLYMHKGTWRSQLCQCADCLTLYADKKVLYLLDHEDTVEFYENKGKQNFNDAKRKAAEAERQILQNMPRAPLLDVMAGINEFKEQLSDYLKQFAEQKKVLTVTDIQEFFARLNSAKRQKTSETSYFCR